MAEVTSYEKVKYILERFDDFDCDFEDVALSATADIFEKAYEVLVANPNITYDEYCSLMDTNWLKFLHHFGFEEQALLVRLYDEDREDSHHEIYQWLNENGFKCMKGFSGCTWVFIDLANREYYPGRAGIQYKTPAGEHSINDDEFYTLMNIINHFSELTELEYDLIKYIFNRKYKSMFVPVKPTKYEMSQVVISRLERLNAGNLVITWSCHNPNIKKCYSLLLENPNITLKDYKELSGWNTKRNGSAGIYTFKAK